MIRVIVVSAKNDKDYWQSEFEKKWDGPVELKAQNELPTSQRYDVLVLDFSGQENAKDILLGISPQISKKNIVIATDKKDADLAIEAIKLGAIGFLVKPFKDEEFIPIINKLKDIVKNSTSNKSAKIITMLSYKGGTGVSTATVNLAYAISESFGKKTLLIDGAGFSNHLTVLLNIPPKCTLYDICMHQQTGSLDEAYFESAVKKVSQNLSIIGGLLKPEELGGVTAAGINKILHLASDIYDYIIIDTPTHSVDEVTMSFIQNSDDIILLTTFDLLTVKDNRFYIQALKDFGVEESKIKPVINRQDWFIGSLEPELVQKQLNHSIYHALPNDWNLCVEAANYGRPLLDFAPNSPLATSYKELAAKITGMEFKNEALKPGNIAESKDQSKKGLFDWFKTGDE